MTTADCASTVNALVTSWPWPANICCISVVHSCQQHKPPNANTDSKAMFRVKAEFVATDGFRPILTWQIQRERVLRRSGKWVAVYLVMYCHVKKAKRQKAGLPRLNLAVSHKPQCVKIVSTKQLCVWERERILRHKNSSGRHFQRYKSNCCGLRPLHVGYIK